MQVSYKRLTAGQRIAASEILGSRAFVSVSVGDAGADVEIGIVESSELLAPPAVLEIRDTRIRGNRVVGAGLGGGGVAVRTGGLVLADGSTVAANETGVGGDGGGLLLREDGAIATPSSVVIEDSEISDNIADPAGGGA